MVRRRKAQIKQPTQGKRIFLVFGPPASGVSSILNVLQSASETPMSVIPYMGPETSPHIDEALLHNDIVFLDVDGGIIDEHDIQDLVDAGYLQSGLGGVVRVHAEPEECLDRAKDREGYVTEDDIREWYNSVVNIEERIRALALQYYMIDNNDLANGVESIALRAGVSR